MAHGASRGRRPDLVGRDRELGQLAAALDDALAGRGALTLITGEPGIGKTALARALAELAAERGARCAWGTCWDGGGAPGYWPWVQILRALARHEDLAALRGELGDGAPWIAGLLPELSGALGAPAQPSELDTDQARFRLYDALATLLAAVAARRPLVLVLDDLHWADASSLSALEFVARTLPDAPILAVAAYRHAEAHAREEIAVPLGGLARVATRLPLQGLSRAAVGLLAARRTGGLTAGRAGSVSAGPPPAEPIVTAVHRATAGNPFFVDELVQLLAVQGRLTDPSPHPDPLPLPDGVRDAIRRRLAPLPEAAAAALDAAAIIGGEFRLGTLAAVLDAGPAEVLDLLEAPLRAGLLVEAPDPGRYAFAHALVRDTLLEGLGAARRARLHRAAAEALERLYADDPEPRLAELAHHFLQAGAETDAERAVAYAERAARRAAAQFAYDEAARLYADAIAAAGALAADDEREWRLARGLGEARMRAGDPAGARAALAGAAQIARRRNDPRRLAQGALADILWGFSPGIVEPTIVAPLEEALEGMETLGDAAPAQRAADDALRTRLRVRLAVALYWSAQGQRRERLVTEALATARALLDDPDADPVSAERTLAFALSQGFVATWGPDTLTRGLPALLEALEICERTGDRELALQIRSWRYTLLLELDDPVRADEALETFGRLARRLAQPRMQLYEPLQRAMREQLRGEFDAAARHTDAAQAQARDVPGSIGVVAATAQAFFQRKAQGRHTELEPAVRAAADVLPAMRAWRCGLALILAELGRDAEARSEVEHLATDDFASIPRDLLWLVSLSMLAEACVRLDDRPRAERLYALMAPYEGRNVVVLQAAYLGPVARFLGLLAMTMGEHERALGHLGTAREAAERLGARPTAVRCALDAAEVLARRGGAGDRERGRSLVEAAAPGATAFGMVDAQAHAQALRARLAGEGDGGAAAALAAAGPGSARLHREGDVWTLTYGGRTVHLQDAKGLHQLARLLAAPGAPVHAAELASGAGGEAPAAPDGAPPLDAYRERLAELREDLDEAEAFNDPERAARAREALQALADEVEARTGGATPPAAGGETADHERARINVTRAIRAALRRIADHDPDLGHLLHTTVRTGVFCVYEPDPRRPVRWDVAA